MIKVAMATMLALAAAMTIEQTATALSIDRTPAENRQGAAAGPADIPALAYKLVEWPAPATNAGGFPAAWNLIQAPGVAVTAAGRVLVLHRGAHPVLEFESAGKFVRSWGDGMISEGKVETIPREKYLLQWGRRGTGPGEFGLPHNVVVDAQNRVYVTDRDNERVQVFDDSGKFLMEWKGTGGVSALALTKDGRIWTGAVLRDLDGKALGRLPEASGAHGAAVDDAGNVYLAQLSGIVQKFVKQ